DAHEAEAFVEDAQSELPAQDPGLPARVEYVPALNPRRDISADRPVSHRHFARVALRAREIGFENCDLFADANTHSARSLQEDLIEPVALDVHRRPRVTEVAERKAAHRAVPVDAASRLADEAFTGDRFRHTRRIA